MTNVDHAATSIGAMRHRLLLEQAVRTSDGGGGVTEAWTTVAELWAALEPTAALEQVTGEAVEGRISHTIEIRHLTGIAPAMRFRLGTRVFEIQGLIDLGERRRRLRCYCREQRL